MEIIKKISRRIRTIDWNVEMRKLRNYVNKTRLKNKDVTLIASNCNGVYILHDLGMKFNSPFVNLWLKPKDFIKFLKNIEYYVNCSMEFTKEEGINYPIGMLSDIKIYFQHYDTEENALSKWNERVKRMNMQNLYVLFSDRDGCSWQDIEEFDALPFENKIIYTHLPYPNIKSAVYIRGFETEEEVGMCGAFKGTYTGRRYYDDFDYVSWFNGKKYK